VALADKLDTLTGFWAIDEKPTGSKDPFALRRAALGDLRLVQENKVRVSMIGLLRSGIAQHAARVLTPHMENIEQVQFEISEIEQRLSNPNSPRGLLVPTPELDIAMLSERKKIVTSLEKKLQEIELRLAEAPADLLSFLHDRLKVFLKDQNIRHDVIDACLAMPGNDDLTLLVKRAQALQATLATDDGANLIAGFKRANNILSQAEEKDGVEYSYGADPKFAETDEERALFTALDTAEGQIKPAMATEDFTTAMQSMATLRAPIDAFFTAVQINTDNQIVRRNRLNLLHRIRTICLSVADLTKLDG
jgi:glycyl-tRNA synthetase beta chain